MTLHDCGNRSRVALMAVTAGLVSALSGAVAETITFSGTVSYNGSHTGDTLYVAALDTTGPEEVTVLDLKSFSVGSPPFSQPYSLEFDNAGTAPLLMVASFLDVDGGGVNMISGLDVFGWYDGQATPASIPSNQSASGLDFSLPRAEIHGELTLAPGQFDARPDATLDPACLLEGFRPQPEITSSGPYSIIGLYPGTYCVSASGVTPMGFAKVCFGDPSCASPMLITLTETEMRIGVDLDFTQLVPVQRVTWGLLKERYR